MIYIGQSLTAIQSRSCLLRWGASTDDDLVGYNVYMSKTNIPEDFEKMNNYLLSEPEMLVNIEARPDEVYYFFVTAVDTLGNESESSNIITFKLKNYKEAAVIPVVPVHKVIKANESFSDKPVTNNFLMKFEIGGF